MSGIGTLGAFVKNALFPPGRCNRQTTVTASDGEPVGLKCQLDEGHSGRHWQPAHVAGWLGGFIPHPDGSIEVPEQYWEDA